MNKPTILYLDDEVDNLHVFKAAFRRDFKVITTTSPLEALQIIEEHEIPVIITDQRMPGMTGIEFLDALPERNKSIKMILTGFSDIESIIYAINKCSISQYIKKPWDRVEVSRIVNEAIEKFQAEKQTKLMLDELKISNEKLATETRKEKLKASTFKEFIGMISHELRTPMNGIINIANLSLLDSEKEISEKNLRQIVASSEDLLEIIESLTTKIDNEENKTFIAVPFNLVTLLDKMINRYANENKKSDLLIVQEHENQHLIEQEIIGNPEVLWLILDSLMSNAVKFTNSGLVKLHTNVLAINDHSIYIEFKVIDTGKGIAPEEQTHILSLFNPDKKNISNKSHLDIGLPLIKRLIRSENSELHIDSQVNKGSTFSFSIKFALQSTV